MGHPQPPTTLVTDNSTAQKLMTGHAKQRQLRAMHVRNWWLKDQIELKNFNLKWESGKTNKADYYTKTHPPPLHKRLRPIYLHTNESPSTLQGCIKIMRDPVSHGQQTDRIEVPRPLDLSLSHLT